MLSVLPAIPERVNFNLLVNSTISAAQANRESGKQQRSFTEGIRYFFATLIFFEIMQLPASREEGIAKRNICIFVGLMIYDEINSEHGGVESHFVFDPMVLMFVR
jgi:hypothetical protein